MSNMVQKRRFVKARQIKFCTQKLYIWEKRKQMMKKLLEGLLKNGQRVYNGIDRSG